MAQISNPKVQKAKADPATANPKALGFLGLELSWDLEIGVWDFSLERTPRLPDHR
jgi:hypothetical protein